MIEKWTSPQNMEHFAVNRLQAQTGGPLSLSLSLHMDGDERILGTTLRGTNHNIIHGLQPREKAAALVVNSNIFSKSLHENGV